MTQQHLHVVAYQDLPNSLPEVAASVVLVPPHHRVSDTDPACQWSAVLPRASPQRCPPPTAQTPSLGVATLLVLPHLDRMAMCHGMSPAGGTLNIYTF